MHKRRISLVLALVFLVSLLLCGCNYISNTDNNSVHFIDVGQGDSIFVKTDDACILVDTGPKDAGETVADYLEQQSVDALDYLILTHPHADHIGGADDVLNEFEVKNIIMPTIPESVMPTTKVFNNMLDLILEKDINVIQAVPGSKYEFGEDYFEILAPNKEYRDLNLLSVVTRFSIDGKIFLITGDAEAESEDDILKEFSDISADVLKVGHHGSSTSTSEKFLKAVSPSTAVIMCGEDNSYGHPHDEIVELLDEYEIDYYRTDECGDIVMTVKDGEISIHKEID